MTVGTKVHQTLVSCESAVANLKSFALDTENQQAKALYADLAQKMDQQIVQPLKQQCNSLEQQEPQYKVFDQAQQQATNSMQQGGQQQGQQMGQQDQQSQMLQDASDQSAQFSNVETNSWQS
jgi:hypothetical protein